MGCKGVKGLSAWKSGAGLRARGKWQEIRGKEVYKDSVERKACVVDG